MQRQVRSVTMDRWEARGTSDGEVDGIFASIEKDGMCGLVGEAGYSLLIYSTCLLFCLEGSGLSRSMHGWLVCALAILDGAFGGASVHDVRAYVGWTDGGSDALPNRE